MNPYTPRPSLLRQRDIESPCCSNRTCDGTGSRRVGSGRVISPMNACRKDTDHDEPRSTQQRDRPGQYSLLRKTVGRNEPERLGSRACGRQGQLRRRSHCEALRETSEERTRAEEKRACRSAGAGRNSRTVEEVKERRSRREERSTGHLRLSALRLLSLSLSLSSSSLHSSHSLDSTRHGRIRSEKPANGLRPPSPAMETFHSRQRPQAGGHQTRRVQGPRWEPAEEVVAGRATRP